ncbi:putative CtpA-like serine protease [termite gut metagenome]|uniref:Putative CtpA-like serine protease n=1 Tax=termite gut metagenome TaxID=433724 RepID=A0A5J4S4U3_9ZZZZ
MNLKLCELKTIKIVVVFLCLLFFACGEDRRKEYEPYNGVQKWVEGIMRKDYYWYQDMPDAKGLNFFTEPNAFFQSLLSQNDGKQRNGSHYYYSVLENLSETDTRSIQQTDYSYGFEFRVYRMGGGNQYGALILYVVPDSPAGKIGLKRGEWIFEIDGKPLSEANYTTLFGGDATKLGLGVWYGNGFVPIGEYAIEAARKINDNPIHYYTIYQSVNDNNKRIGYLVYNHFTAGINDEDTSYDDDLREISHEFKDTDVNEFILDLRYNNGGLLTSAELLCTILAPESALGKSIGYVEFNDKYSPQTQNISLDTNILKGGVNLNLNTLYVLISETSASASEMVINSLSPYMKIVLIGTQTEGKNVGSTTYKNEEYNWELRPIICKMYNSENKSDYADGFMPDYKADESLDTNISSFLDFGNPNELLLNTALQLIGEAYTKEEDNSVSRSLIGKPVPVHCSLDRKATNGVIIR